MCGIAAIFAHGSSAPCVDEAELRAIRDRMVHRGPDGHGLWISGDRRVGLAHRRLSIIDLSDAGAQPMWNGERTLCIIYNGELYNFRALRKRLVDEGCQFASECDTEVLLHLFERRGAAMLDELRGMYAFAIWDAREHSLFAARDPFGIKPLYYSNADGVLRLASSVKALLTSKHIDRTREPAAEVGYYLWGSLPDPFTLHRGILSLPAGHTLTQNEGAALEVRAFSSISEILRDAERTHRGRNVSSEEQHDLLHAALRDSAEHHLVADVPVGVFLSSGLDSSTLAALVTEAHKDVRTVTLGFQEYRRSGQDEAPLAEVVARRYGTNHQTIWVSRRDFEGEAEKLFDAMDVPSIDGVNTYFVSLAARRAGLKVALSGVGGDEMFAGYPSFKHLPRIVAVARQLHRVGKQFRIVTSEAIKRFTSPKYAGIFEYGASYSGAYLLRRSLYMPWELLEFLDPEVVREGWERLHTLHELSHIADSVSSPRLKISALELSWYMRHQLLRDSDWAGMAHSLEIRVPFVDLQLLRQIAPLLSSANPPGKHDMAMSPREPLPTQLLSRRKTGFTVPVREWLMQSIDPLASGERGLRGWARYVFDRFAGDEAASSRATRAPNGHRNGGADTGFRRAIKTKTVPTNIIVYRIGQLGDTIVALPAMWAIRENFPDARMTLLCDQHPQSHYLVASDLLKDSGIFHDFLAYPVDPDPIASRRKLLELLGELRARRFDTLAYLAPSGRTPARVRRDRLFFRAAGIKNFIGMKGFPPLPKRSVSEPLAATRRESEMLLLRLRQSGLAVSLRNPKFSLGLNDRDENAVDTWLELQIARDAGRPWVAVAPGSKMPSKQWPLERYDAVVRDLIGSYDIWPVVFGGSEDAEIGTGLIDRWGRGYNAAGALNVRAAKAALKRCVLYLGNDTGTMHLAAAAGIRCVALFSSRERPGLWYPSGVGHQVFRSDIECEGCGLTVCITRENECLRRITADQVTKACRTVLSPTAVGAVPVAN